MGHPEDEEKCFYCGNTDEKSNLWGCEQCGVVFCEDCSQLDRPVSWWEPILCNTCLSHGYKTTMKNIDTGEIIKEL